MRFDLRRTLGRLAYPRSRRSQLWACAYCAAFDGGDRSEPDDAGLARPTN